MFQLLTGVRIDEAIGADWSEVDIDERRWRIPGSRMKNGHEHLVLFSDPALAVLERQQARSGPVFRTQAHSAVLKGGSASARNLGCQTHTRAAPTARAC